MRKILVESSSTVHTQKDLWEIMTAFEDYPTWCKFCKSMTMTPAEVKKGVVFHDVTTLLWIPLTIKHIITKVKPHEELHFFLPLPWGGKMWHKFYFQQYDTHSRMRTEITFDLGNWLFNKTVGYILEKRWVKLLHQGFPGLEEIKRLQ